jgi:hypothetical protein
LINYFFNTLSLNVELPISCLYFLLLVYFSCLYFLLLVCFSCFYFLLLIYFSCLYFFTHLSPTSVCPEVAGRCSSRDYAAVVGRRFRFVIPVGPSQRGCTMHRCVCMFVCRNRCSRLCVHVTRCSACTSILILSPIPV